MIGLGSLPAIAFAAPAVLAALVALPAIWWLLRLTPPRPRRQDFPPTALIADLMPTETTPAATPWWLLALRLALAALVILALAEPVHRPATALPGRAGPLWLIIDTGWPAAEDEAAIRTAAETALDRAAAEDRPVLLVGSTDGAGQLFEPVSVDEARHRLAVVGPRPFADDRTALLPGLARAGDRLPPGAVVWIAHGLDLAGDAAAFADGLVRAAAGAPLALSLPARSTTLALAGLDDRLDALVARVIRPPDGTAATATVRAFDRRGRLLAESPAAFAAGADETTARFALPTEIRNDLARLAIAGHDTAGAVALIDERARRRAVGLLAGSGLDAAQPLLAPTHYLDAALAPVADLRRPRAGELGPAVGELLDRGVAVILAADVGTFPAEAGRRLGDWVAAGGVLIRFAGPRLAAGREADPLLPVVLRRGERTLGGALSWGRPRALAPFPATSPFTGLALPTDVAVSRQILAEPAADLSERTWAALDDGTPLVTALRRGRGWLVLFHVGADTAWSNLPLSGTFVEMLRRITALAAAVPSRDDAAAAAPAIRTVLPPLRLLDGAGRLGPPSPEARPIAVADLDRLAPSPDHPPGLWGDEAAPLARPTLRPDARLTALPAAVEAVAGRLVRRGTDDAPTPLAPALLVAALVLALVDGGLALTGRLGGLRRRLLARGLGVVALGLLLAPAPPATAAETAAAIPSTAEAFARDAAVHARLAYVRTGDDGLDEISRRGLAALGRALADRTAFEPEEPIGVDPARDDLAFFPLVYWPIAADRPPPDPAALGRIDAFMKHGGTVVFDTRDALDAGVAEPLGRRTPAAAALVRLLAGLDLPELEPVPADHVLGRTFYLLREFPGRFDGPRPWVEATTRDGSEPGDRPARPGDGVSPIVITGNDLAGAWAADDGDGALLPMASTDPRGREMALRVGINLVMYVLTGNYKADQVHVPALLERLGR